ncbi:HAD-IA family hydrolase [Rodentibacter caecimuris]|uniref:HAD family hydrolase n=1 Tax=Rodentibacter caecimuris TaxID=1796644 RepID=A0ABX3L1D3_9PAST|nr:HAD family hydrolase [Rodentibacter heylii]
MRFYRSLQPFKLLSFDLDDTLYDNFEVIRNAEATFLAKVREISGLAQIDSEYWQYWKQQIFSVNSILYEDVTVWRRHTLTELLKFHGKNDQEIDRTLQIAMAEFMIWRHKISVPPQHIDILWKLKQHCILTIITNGNVDAKKLGLDMFDFVLRGGEQGRAKPHADLFLKTAAHFHLKMNEILHVGDNLHTDVQGAIQAGCQAIWMNFTGKNIMNFNDGRILPSLEINELSELLRL